MSTRQVHIIAGRGTVLVEHTGGSSHTTHVVECTCARAFYGPSEVAAEAAYNRHVLALIAQRVRTGSVA